LGNFLKDRKNAPLSITKTQGVKNMQVTWTTENCYEQLKKDEINLDTKFPYTHETKTDNKSKKLSLGRI